MLRRLFVAAAVLAIAAAIFIWSALPPRRQTLAASLSDGTIPGILHVHSVRSDGRGTQEQIAHAAAVAGLKFIVITDHGDATHAPDAPVYREGVLCLNGTEVSTRDGHYIALDMPASPYPLGGEGRDVVDDVKRLGGFGIVAHPDSPKLELRWRAWSAPFDGVEIVNLDTMWRTRMAAATWRPKAGLALRLLTYLFRPQESIASLVQRSTAFSEWSALAEKRHVVLVAGADAHGQIAWRASDPIQARLSVAVPSYQSVFRTLSVRVRPERPLTGNAKTDAAIVFRALRSGHVYSVVDGVATPPSVDFTATNTLGTVRMGDQLDVSGPATLRVRSNAPEGYTTTIWNGTKGLAVDRHETEFSVVAEDAGVYWVEIHPGGARSSVPWVTTNPVYVRRLSAPQATPSTPTRPDPTESTSLFDGRSTERWRIDTDGTSRGAVDIAAPSTALVGLRLRFGLATAPATNQFVALTTETPNGVAPNDRIAFAARAEHPMRMSVQLLTERTRWVRSVYVDTFNQTHTIFFDDFRPVEEGAPSAVSAADVKAALFVVDTTNTKPGTTGRMWITAPELQK